MATAHTNPATERPLQHDSERPAIWAFLRQQGGQWHATAVDYSIVGSGSTPEEASESLRAMVEEYLRSCARNGLSAEEARRPIPPRWTVALVIDLLREVVRLVLHRQSGRRGGRVLLPRHGC